MTTGHEILPDPHEAMAQRLLAEARIQALSTADPRLRAELLAVAIAEGDSGIDSSSPYAAYAEIGEEDGKDPSVYHPLQQKRDASLVLVRALTRGGRFQEACQITNDLDRLDSRHSLLARCAMLERGYAGPGGELLNLLTDDYLYVVPDEIGAAGERMMEVEDYLMALTAYGIDVSAEGGPYSELFGSLMRIEPDTWQQQRRLKFFGAAAARNARNLPLAVKYRDNVMDHSLRAELDVEISRTTEDPSELSALLADVQEQLVEAAVCDGTCGDKHCGPKHITPIALETAHLCARLGDTAHARELLLLYNDGFHFDRHRLDTYSELYAQEGRDEDRREALLALNSMTNFISEFMTPYIRKLAAADLQFGRSLPGLTMDQEVVPMLAWELQQVYGQIDELEAPWTSGPYAELLRSFLGLNDEQAAANRARWRLEAKDQALAILAIYLTELGLPHSALELIATIDDPVESVRARVAVATRLLGNQSG